MKSDANAWVYILASRKNGTLYIGVTADLQLRVWQHKRGFCGGFTRQYRVTTLVHVEKWRDIGQAIAREKALKGWIRKRKIALIESTNPDWDDLAASWFEDGLGPSLRSG